MPINILLRLKDILTGQKLNKEHERMKTSESQMAHANEKITHEAKGIEIPIQTLFDECLNFISVNDFNP